MATEKKTWRYLIRFINAEDDRIYFGDAILPADASGIHDTGGSALLSAYIIDGNPLSSEYQITGKQVLVKKLLGPLTRDLVPDIRCIGGNYASHLKELGVPFPKIPPMFPKSTNALAGHRDIITIPTIAQDDQADYEGELAVVIGRDAKNISANDALDYVIGYSVANDVSARKWQMDAKLVGTIPPPQMSFSKSFDGFCPIGPCIVSSKVIPDPHVLSLSTRVNKDLRQQGFTSDLIFDVAKIIEFCSQGTTIYAGTVILTGTPSGVGMAMKPPSFLKHGDEVDITIEKIGTLHNQFQYA